MPRNRKPEPPGARAKRQGALQHRRKMSLVQELIDLYAETLRRQRPHQVLLDGRTYRIFKSPEWAKLSQYDHQFILGVDHILMQQLWQQMVFSYEHNGERLRLNTREYRAVSVHDINTDTGAYVYEEPPHRLFTQPGAHNARKEKASEISPGQVSTDSSSGKSEHRPSAANGATGSCNQTRRSPLTARGDDDKANSRAAGG